MYPLSNHVSLSYNDNGANVEIVPLMMCPECFGKGGTLLDTGGTTPWGEPVDSWITCNECGGCGVIHCCEGDQPVHPCVVLTEPPQQ